MSLSRNASGLEDVIFCRAAAVPLAHMARLAGLPMPAALKALRELEVAGLVTATMTLGPSGTLVALTGRGAELALGRRNERAVASARGAA